MSHKSVLFMLSVLGVVIALLIVITPSADAILLQGTFVDDNQSPHQNGIEALAALGITQGCNPPSNDRFCPDRDMTRAEAATFMARAYGFPDDGVDYFTDDDGHPLEGGINKIAAAGITAGCNPPANDRFCPDRALTRAEWATFIVRAEHLPPSAVDHFIDDNGHVLESAINSLADAGITVGCNPPTNTFFCPGRVLTRGETATFLTRALSLSHNPQMIPLTNWTPITCSKDGIQCSMVVDTFSGRTHRVNEGLFQKLPYGPGEEATFLSNDTEFAVSLNGSPVSLSEAPLSQSSTRATRMWATNLVFSDGTHILIGEWRRNGVLIQRTTVALNVD